MLISTYCLIWVSLALLSLTYTMPLLEYICALGALYEVYHYAESRLQWLRMALEKHKRWLAVLWATVNV